MAKYKRYDYSQMVLLPVSLSEQLMPGTLEFAIHRIVENHLDLTCFEERFKNDETGCTAYDPKVVLKVVLLAYARGIVSSRKMERACKENVIFMALTCEQHPDHSTIAAFISSMKEEIEKLFREVLLICEEMNLLGGTELSLDGLRLPGNASKQWSGTRSALKAKQERLEARVKQMVEKHIEEDKKEDEDRWGRANRERQIERLEKKAKRIREFLEENEAKPGKQYKEVKSKVTDNESAMMSTSHGVIQGYNAQALVDSKHQVIVCGEAFGWGQDHYHLEPVLDGAKENMKAIGKGEGYFAESIVTADTAYHSGESLKKCEQEEIDTYIPDKDYRKRDPRFSPKESSKARRRKKFSREDFNYDETCDEYECPNGKRLKLQTTHAKANGIVYRRYHADAKDCEGCSERKGCINKKGAGKRKVLMIPTETDIRNYSKERAAKMDTDRGRRMYPRRIAIVEPVFANIRTQKMLDRFTLRVKVKVNIQWLLYCIVHNIEKIAHFGFAPA